MNPKSTFMEECERLKSSEKFQGIAKFSLENLGSEHRRKISWEKFETGAHKVADWLGKTYKGKPK